MSQGKLMIVNGECEVLKEHCVKSNYAALYYIGKSDFIAKLYLLDTTCEELRNQMGERARRYVTEFYSWSIIMNRLKTCIEMFN